MNNINTLNRSALCLVALLGGLIAGGYPNIAAAQTPVVTAETITPFQETLGRGGKLKLTYKFSATGPLSPNKKVFVHIVNSAGTILLHDDHYPPAATSTWGNESSSPIPEIKYRLPHDLTIPSDMPFGDYKILIGLYNESTNAREILNHGDRVTEASPDSRSYVVANLTVTARPIRNASAAVAAKCSQDVYSNPSTWPDATLELNNDLALVSSGTSITSQGQIYKLPPGGCRYSGTLSVFEKKYVDIVGAGIPDTVLYSGNRSSSAIVVTRGEGVTVRDIKITTAKVPGDRKDFGNARGVYLEETASPTVKRMRIENIAGGGIVFWNTTNGSALNNEIVENESDGIHVTGENSTNTVIQHNWAFGTGDDSYASVGYVGGSVTNTKILNNYSGSSKASGITIEGTNTATVEWNEVKDSAVAGIRVASIQGGTFQTAGVSGAVVKNNLFEGVRTRCTTDHAAVMIFADVEAVSGITFSNNRIVNPNTADGIRVRGAVNGAASPQVSSVSISGNALTTTTGLVQSCSVLQQCVNTGPNATLTKTGNTWNGSASACNN